MNTLRKLVRKVISESIVEPSLLEPGKIYNYKGEITRGKHTGELINGKLKFERREGELFRFIVISFDNPNANKNEGESFVTSREGLTKYISEIE
jgi:hypothetical protein